MLTQQQWESIPQIQVEFAPDFRTADLIARIEKLLAQARADALEEAAANAPTFCSYCHRRIEGARKDGQ